MGEAINPWLHILAATIWVGPQVFLFVAAVPAIRTVDDAQARGRAMRVLTTRFGYLGWGAMIVLVITGVGNLFELAPVDVGDIWDLNYGSIFLAKMVLLGAVIAVTAFHSFFIGPRMLMMQESVRDEAQIAATRRVSIMVSALGLLISLGILFCSALLNTDFALE